jgi:hypothetical protein
MQNSEVSIPDLISAECFLIYGVQGGTLHGNERESVSEVITSNVCHDSIYPIK